MRQRFFEIKNNCKFFSCKKLAAKRGFSLVEVLIVMAIMVIMTATIFLNRNDKKPFNDVEVASRQIASQVRSLQNEALNGKRFDTNGDGVNDINACGMRFNTNPQDATKTYMISYYDCNSVPGLIAGSLQKLHVGKSSTDASVNIQGDYYVQFNSPRADILTNLPVFPTTPAIEIKSVGNSAKSLVCIYSNGSILETSVVAESEILNCP